MRKTKTETITTNWVSKRASGLRSQWKKRMEKAGLPLDTLPTTQEIKQFILDARPYTDYYEGFPLEESDVGFDHDIPVYRGGTFDLGNIVICSKQHNSSKGSLTGDEYRELLRLIRSWVDRGEGFLSRLRAANTIFTKRKSFRRKK